MIIFGFLFMNFQVAWEDNTGDVYLPVSYMAQVCHASSCQCSQLEINGRECQYKKIFMKFSNELTDLGFLMANQSYYYL